MSAICLMAAVPSSVVLADGQKVVTLGADLSEEQKQAILRYFGVAGQNLQTLTITNQDERDHLGSYVPLEQIGTRTYSCALVNPTASGGIQVKTANLSWVTSNMIATTLSTSGVVNCEVLAAAPFEVSGTGALTGILMAYESAVGATLDSGKKEVATQELITTTTIANTIGQVQATEIVNESKKQIIQGNVVSNNDIDIIINEVAEEEGISLSEEEHQLLVDLMQQIAEQDYNYAEMQETLERVEANMEDLISGEEDDTELAAPATDASEAESIGVIGDGADASTQTETQEALSSDSILMNTDDSALGSEVIFDATDSSALAETEAPADIPVISDEASDISIIPDDQTDITVIPEQTEAVADGTGSEEQAEIPADGTGSEEQAEIPADTAEPEGQGEASDVSPEDAEASPIPEAIPAEDMEFAPLTSEKTDYEVFPAGINELTVDIARNDITGGTGTLTLYTAADSSIIETISLSDSSKVTVLPLTENELFEKGWISGSRAVVRLTDPLAPATNYFVMLSDDAFRTSDGTGTTAATPDSYNWTINTGEFGFYINDTAKGITAGTPVSGQIMMDGTAATYACIELADFSVVSFDVTEFAASGSFTVTFSQPGTTSFQVSFYDETGSCLDTIDYSVTVK